MAGTLGKIARVIRGRKDLNGIGKWPEWQTLLAGSPYRFHAQFTFSAAGLTAFGVGPLPLPLVASFSADFHALFSLLRNCPDRFSLTEAGELHYYDEDITLAVPDCDACYVIEELLLDQLYRFRLPDGSPLVVADVGMNIGLSCLYFAARPEVEKVYGFEPFTATYNKALKNLALNDALKQKIEPRNYGWEAESRTIQVPVQQDRTLINSTSDFFLAQRGVRADSFLTVQVADAAAVLQDLQAAHPGCRLGLKLDCEGAEYAIMQRLSNAGMLTQLSMVLLEWHYQGTEALEKLLTASGFSLMVLTNPRMREVGMLYAFKS